MVRQQPTFSAALVTVPQLAFVLCSFLYFLLPSKLLINMGWDYEGGGPGYQKIHVATYLVIVTFCLLLVIDSRFRVAAISLFFKEPILIAFLASIGFVAFYAIGVKHTSIAPFIDTFIMTVVLAIGYLSLPIQFWKVLKFLCDVFLISNVAILFMEYYTKTNILTTEKFVYFRASGLFDSPLYAATIMGVYLLIILVGTRMTLSLQCAARLLLVVFSFGAILATGGRASLFATICSPPAMCSSQQACS